MQEHPIQSERDADSRGLKHHPHLYDIQSNLEPLDENAEFVLLIDRDVIEAIHIAEQIV